MSQLPPHEALAIASSLVAGMFMLHVSLRKKAVRWKTPTRCPSCGRARRAHRVCENCS
jgi:hypothetical protein